MLWLVLSGITAVIGAGYSLAAGGTPAIGATVGLVLGGSLMALELFVLQRRPGEALRQLPLPIYILISTVLWVVIISICVELVPALMELDEPDDEPDDDPTAFGQDLAFALLVSLVLNTGLRIGALVGPRFLFNFLVGRYHRPLHEDRVFMFLDLADSTQLAEELGDLRAQSLIRQFFFDIASPIAAHGGETHRYIGGEVVATSGPSWRRDARGTRRALAPCPGSEWACTAGRWSPARSVIRSGRSSISETP